MAKTDNNDESGVRARIVMQAMSEFARYGEELASVRRIAKDSGVTAAMINYYFDGKAGLYEAVLAEAQRGLYERLHTTLTTTPADSLAVALALGYFDFLVEQTQMQQILLRQVLDNGGRNQMFAERFVQPLRGLLQGYFGQQEDVVQKAISLFGAISGYFIYEPVLSQLLGADPLSPLALQQRREHIARLAETISAGETVLLGAKDKNAQKPNDGHSNLSSARQPKGRTSKPKGTLS